MFQFMNTIQCMMLYKASQVIKYDDLFSVYFCFVLCEKKQAFKVNVNLFIRTIALTQFTQ